MPRAIGVHEEQIGDVAAAADAGDALEDAGGGEDDAAVWQVAGIVIVHIRFGAGRDLAKACAIGSAFPDLPALVAADHGKQHAFAIEVQIDIADHHGLPGFEKDGGGFRRAWVCENADAVLIAGAGQRTIALPILREAESRAVCVPPDEQQLLEIQQGIGQQGFAAQGGEGFGRWLRAERIEALQEFFAIGIPLAEG